MLLKGYLKKQNHVLPANGNDFASPFLHQIRRAAQNRLPLNSVSDGFLLHLRCWFQREAGEEKNRENGQETFPAFPDIWKARVSSQNWHTWTFYIRASFPDSWASETFALPPPGLSLREGQQHPGGTMLQQPPGNVSPLRAQENLSDHQFQNRTNDLSFFLLSHVVFCLNCREALPWPFLGWLDTDYYPSVLLQVEALNHHCNTE